jgi:hypothetical protein
MHSKRFNTIISLPVLTGQLLLLSAGLPHFHETEKRSCSVARACVEIDHQSEDASYCRLCIARASTVAEAAAVASLPGELPSITRICTEIRLSFHPRSHDSASSRAPPNA